MAISHMEDLPYDVVERILKDMTVNELVKLRSTSKSLKVAIDEVIKRRHRGYFGSAIPVPLRTMIEDIGIAMANPNGMQMLEQLRFRRKRQGPDWAIDAVFLLNGLDNKGKLGLDESWIRNAIHHLNGYSSMDPFEIKITCEGEVFNWNKKKSVIRRYYHEPNKLWETWRTLGRYYRLGGPAWQIWVAGIKHYEGWYNGNGFHRVDGPAQTLWNNGTPVNHSWSLDGLHHRDDGPAIIVYYKNGVISNESWYRNGSHRDDGPAIIDYHLNGAVRSKTWVSNDSKNSIYYDENGVVNLETWYWKGKYHRDDGPALINHYENGVVLTERWYRNGTYHRDGGPAIIDYYENGAVRSESWYRNGKFEKGFLTAQL